MKKDTYKKKQEKLIQKQKRRIRNLRKRGYILPDFEEMYNTPKTSGKKVYESMLKKFTLEDLYSKATARDEDTGKLLSGKQLREKEREEKAKRGAITRKRKREMKERGQVAPPFWAVVIAGVRRQIAETEGSVQTDKMRGPLSQLFEKQIAKDGEEVVGRRIKEDEAKAEFLIGAILQPSPRGNDVQVAIYQFAKLIKGEELDKKEMENVELYLEELDAWEDMD